MPRKDGKPAAVATPDPPMLGHALDWARQGWPVFPLKPGDKIPLLPSPHKKGTKCQGECGKLGHGCLDGTTDEATIRRWWQAQPRANVGGATTGRVVFDFDLQHGAQRLDVFPPTREHLSGRGNGNVHLVYRVGGELAQQIAAGTNVLGPGIDIRATSGAYVALPPSTHPDTGQPYTVANPEVEEHQLTDSEVVAIWEAYGVALPGQRKTPRKASDGTARDTTDTAGILARSEAERLLLAHPERGQGLTNDALATVAGYYARMFHNKPDLYKQHVRDYAAKIDPDYEDTETVLGSIWGSEEAQRAGQEDEHERGVEERLAWLRIRDEADRLRREERRRDSEEAGHFVGGAEFVLNVPDNVPIWGAGQRIGWNSGEALMLVGPNGVGKSTIAVQLVRARLAGGEVLGLPVAPTESKVLYLAMDRPMQIRRLLNHYLQGVDPEVLAERLIVWPGPPPADIAGHPETLLELAQQAGADTVVVDSLKDAAVGLSNDEVGAAYNRARQIALNGGVEVLELHHMVKKGANGTKPDTLEDVYGSIWLTAGAGSVVLLWGTAGDLLVELSHLKQPVDSIGSLQVHHDRERAVSTVSHERDPLSALVQLTPGGQMVTANGLAASLYGTDKPTDAETERMRKKLAEFERLGWAEKERAALKTGRAPATGWRATELGRAKSRNASGGGDGVLAGM